MQITRMQLQDRDHASLLLPIDPDAPAGQSLRYDPVYDHVSSARRGEDPSLSQGVWQRDLQQSDWAAVEELCYTALQTRSKDLQLAVWLTEAWLHLYGLCGFTSGCQLITELHESYLLTMFPTPLTHTETLPLDAQDDAVEHRLNMLQWLNEKLSIEIKLLPLTAPYEHSGVASVSLAQIEAAQHRSHAARQGPNAPPVGPLDAGLARSLELTSDGHLAQTWTDLHHALEVVTQLGATLDRCYGDANGGLLSVAEVLNEMVLAIAPALPVRSHVIAAAAANSSPTPSLGMEPPTSSLDTFDSSPVHPLSNGLQSREEAYALLAEVADFLAQLEPHSPVPYLLQRAIAWGNMSLKELLPELLNDQAALKDVGHLLRLEGSAAHK